MPPGPEPSPAQKSAPDWQAVAGELAVALDALQEGWLYQTAAGAKDCPPPIRKAAAEKFCTALDLRRAALAAYRTAKSAA